MGIPASSSLGALFMQLSNLDLDLLLCLILSLVMGEERKNFDVEQSAMSPKKMSEMGPASVETRSSSSDPILLEVKVDVPSSEKTLRYTFG